MYVITSLQKGLCAEGTGTQVQRPQRSQGGAAVVTVGVQVLVRNRQTVAVARASLTTDLPYCAEGTGTQVTRPQRSLEGAAAATVGYKC